MNTFCIDCGTVTPAGNARCDTCRRGSIRHRIRKHSKKTAPQDRGYDAQWKRLSARARKLQPFCTDCGTTHDLQADHTPEAWDRKERGLAVRLQDIDVVCAPCNRKRGAARGENAHKRRRAPKGTAPTHGHAEAEKGRQTDAQTPGGSPPQVTRATPVRPQVSVQSHTRSIHAGPIGSTYRKEVPDEGRSEGRG